MDLQFPTIRNVCRDALSIKQRQGITRTVAACLFHVVRLSEKLLSTCRMQYAIMDKKISVYAEICPHIRDIVECQSR